MEWGLERVDKGGFDGGEGGVAWRTCVGFAKVVRRGGEKEGGRR